MKKALQAVTAIALLIMSLSSSAFSAVDCHTQIDPNYLLIDVKSLIHIEKPADIDHLRTRIIDLFWPKGFPKDKLPLTVNTLTKDNTPDWIKSIESENIAKVDKLDIAMDYEMHSYIYHLRPKNANNRLIIFQMGHSDDILTAGGRETITYFLERGYAIMTLWMPLFGENPRTAQNIPDKGSVTFPTGTKGHNVMSQTIDDSKGCFIRFFIEPVIIAINHAKAEYQYNDINMIGISGGGWTTHVCAAIDTRIKQSFPVSGALPLFLRRGACANGSQGDAEQEWGALFEEIASWLDVYIMGGYGDGRTQIHILNQYDSCCFWGVNYRTFEGYVQDAVLLLGDGYYEVYLDSTHREHKISQKVISEVIDKHLGQP